MFGHQLIAFTLAVGLLTLIPGADTMLVMRNAIGRGNAAGVATAFGIGSGLFVQAGVSALGLSAILMRSAELYSAIKLAGAIYLAALGLWTVFKASQGPKPEIAEETVSPAARVGVGQSYAEGLITNILNPKIVVFYLAFLPQFIAPSDPVIAKSMLLAGIHFVLTIAWLSMVTFALGRMGGWITRPAIKRRLDYFTGIVLVGLGARLALEHR